MAGGWDTPPTEAERVDPWAAPPTEAERVGPAPYRSPDDVPTTGLDAFFGHFGDNIPGARQLVAAGLAAKMKADGSPMDFGENYRQLLLAQQRELNRSKTEHGGLSRIGSLAGLAGSAAVLPGAGWKSLAALGGLSGLSDATADPTKTAGEVAAQTTLSAIAAPILGKAIGAGVNWATPALRAIANSKAVESLGTKLAQYRDIAYKESMQRLGKTLLDNGIIPWLGGSETMANRAGAEMGKQAKTIQATIGSLDTLAKEQHAAAVKEAIGALEASGKPAPGLIPLSQLEPTLAKTPMAQWAFPPGSAESGAAVTNAGNVARDLTQKAAAPAGAGMLPQPYVRLPAVRQQAEEELLRPLLKLARTARPVAPEAIEAEISGMANPTDRMSIAEANQNLQGMDERVRAERGAYGKELSPMGERLKQLRGILRGEQQAAAERIDPQLAAKLATSKATFGDLADAFNISGDSSLRDLANRDHAPTDYAVGLAQLAAGHPATAILAALAHRGIRRGGNAFTARTAQGAANLGDLLSRYAVPERLMSLSTSPIYDALQGFSGGSGGNGR